MKFIACLVGCLVVLRLAAVAGARSFDMKLRYDHPAKVCMNEALPLGNGRLGAMVFGIPEAERIVLNEDSLWTGGSNPTGAYGDDFGAYQTVGELQVNLPGHAAATNYVRDLDLTSAISHVSYQLNDVRYDRELLVSFPDQVIILHLSASKPASLTGDITLVNAHSGKSNGSDHSLSFDGVLPNGLKYGCIASVESKAGTVKFDQAKLVFNGCDDLVVTIAARTNYAMNSATEFRTPGCDPSAVAAADITNSLAHSFDARRDKHVANYQAFFNRVAIDLGESTPAQRAMFTDVRKQAAHTSPDPELEATLFQLGRYLLISSSRPGSLPANLQGIWNEKNDPAWHCDYHANINIQMNYWPAETTNLPECHQPLFDLIESQLPAWRKATAASKEFRLADGRPSPRGFAIRTSHNIFGGLGWNWDKTANAWYCQHLWEHYAFGGDKKFLQQIAYPIMKETCQFWQDHLKTLPDGRVVVPMAWSPEHGPTEDGVSYSQEIIYDLFTNTISAADALDVDKPFREEIGRLRAKLAVPGVGSWGQLLEWMTEKHSKELDTKDDHHRHTSHLFAVFPGRQISLLGTPELAAAARVSLAARGDSGDVREWSFAWRTALWARLREGDKAHGQIMQLFDKRNTCLNLFGLHPPMQIDGNFGITAAIAEMLLQSQDGSIDLLPALPTAWKSGGISGLRARGGITVDIQWVDGQLRRATLHGPIGAEMKLRYAGKTATVTAAQGAVTVDGGLTIMKE